MSEQAETAQIFPLVFNQSNLVPGTNNSRYRINFPRPVNFKNSMVSIGSASLYYSWPNISQSAYNNNVYQVIVPVGAGNTTLTITMPEGYYTASDMNSYLQSQLIANNIGYLVDGSGNFIYYFQIQSNATYYSLELDLFLVPNSLPTGWTNPGSWSLPGTARTGQFVISSTNNFSRILGITAGTYPSTQQASNFSKLSDTVPQISPVQSIILTCSLLQNDFASIPNVLYSFTSSNAQYGANISSSPSFPQFCSVVDGQYSYIEIQFLDQSFNVLPIKDPNICCTLMLKI